MKIDVKRNDAIKLHAHWVLYFHEVMNAGSIRGAAKVLNVSPSVISRQLKDIEEILGQPIFERISKGLRPTVAGEVIAGHVRDVLRGLVQVQDALDEITGLRRGHISLVAPFSSASELLPSIMVPFVKQHPRITFSCNFAGSTVVVERIDSGEADIGIAFDPPKSRVLRRMVSVPVPFGAVMSPDNPLARRKSLKFYDFVNSNLPLIFPDETISARGAIEDVLARSSLDVQPVVTSSNRDFIVGLVKGGVGVAFQTPVGIERELREKSLVFVPMAESTMKPRQLTVVVPALRRLSTVSGLMVEAMTTAISALVKK